MSSGTEPARNAVIARSLPVHHQIGGFEEGYQLGRLAGTEQVPIVPRPLAAAPLRYMRRSMMSASAAPRMVSWVRCGCGHAGDEAPLGEPGRAGRCGNAEPAIRCRAGDLFGHHIGRREMRPVFARDRWPASPSRRSPASVRIKANQNIVEGHRASPVFEGISLLNTLVEPCSSQLPHHPGEGRDPRFNLLVRLIGGSRPCAANSARKLALPSCGSTISAQRMKTLLLDAGVPVHVVLPRAAGHDAAVLLRVYAKRTRKADTSAAAIIGALSKNVLG